MAKLNRTLLIIASVASLAACGKKPPPELPPNPEGSYGSGSQGSGTGTGGWQGGGAAAQGSQADFLASVSADRVFFDTDRYNIDAQDQATLQSQAQWLGRNPGTSVVIEGHADERGTRDYNLALGERRANAAKNYLVALGIDPSRIRTVSFGKERPDALGSNEQAWAVNRRAVTITVQ